MNETELIQKCQAGDNQSFAQLYDAYIRRIYDFVYYKTHHKETAEDITSETFIKALEKINQFDPNSSFKSWLYKIAQNTVIDHYRKSSRAQITDIDDAWDIGSDDDVAADIDTREKIRELRREMKKLSSAERDIVIMRVWQELPYKEIADIVGKSEENCRTIYSRAIRSLKENVSVMMLLLLICKM